MVDDFFAVMVANMYSSELGRPLRRSHANFAVMLPAEAARVPAQYAGLITQFGRRQPALLAGLAQIGSPFNPFRPAP
jgi:hypothetical protein